MRFLLFLLLIVFMSACVPKQVKLKDSDNALLSGNTWEVNRAVMLAGEKSNALEVALRAGEAELEARPDNDEARIIMARLQSRVGRAEQAISTLEGLSSQAAQSPVAQIERARASIVLNRPGEALSFLAGINTDARDINQEVKKLEAVAYDITGQHEMAQEIYKDILSRREDAATRYNYGRSLINSGKYAEASSALMRLVDNPNYPQARILAAGALLHSGDSQGARYLLEGYLSAAEIDKLLESVRVDVGKVNTIPKPNNTREAFLPAKTSAPEVVHVSAPKPEAKPAPVIEETSDPAKKTALAPSKSDVAEADTAPVHEGNNENNEDAQ